MAELIDDLSRNGFEGKFRIVSPTGDQPQAQAQWQTQSQTYPHSQGAYQSAGISTMGVMEQKLQVSCRLSALELS